jgi:hypothetical protein
MGAYQPERAPGASVQQLSRQVQIAVTEALRMLDTIKAIDPASQDEVDSLRSVVWSDLTGLEAEFGREEEPRAEVLDRFFSHLLSNGDHIGQIESLAGALLGGAPPPSQPPPDSPVAGLFRLHGTLTTVRRQWQEVASTREVSHPAPPPLKKEAAVHEKNAFFDEMGLSPPRQEATAAPPVRGRALMDRPPGHPARQSTSERFLDDIGFISPSGPPAPGRSPETEAPRPRVIATFVAVFVILAAMGVGVIFLGLNDNSQGNTGVIPSVVPTFQLTFPVTPLPTPTPSSAPPQLQITGNPLIVPCPTKGTSGFVLRNIGGQTLTWSAKVNRVGNVAQPVTLSATSGHLYGPPNSGTDSVSVTVTSNGGGVSGTITITTNVPDTHTISYQTQNC